MELGDKIRRAMVDAGVKTQAELAGMLQSHPIEVSKWINGKRTPKFETIKKIANVLDKPVSYFIDIPTGAEPLENLVFLKEIGAVRCGAFQLLINENGEYQMQVHAKSILPFKAQRMTLEEIQNKYYIFRAEGDSMVPVILDGDTLIIEKIEDNSFENGEIVLFADSDDSIVCKRIYKTQNGILLQSENNRESEKFPDMEFTGLQPDDEHARILGRVVHIGRVPNKKPKHN
jgi:SOS-response transcriptional repressor LexA